MVWELYDVLRPKPIVGVGGIACANDALEFLMAGAVAVQVGSATFTRPGVMIEIIAGIESYMQQNGFTNTAEICIR
jgi:dihydroorotate dehydrogenase (NAD+) catalytic subunit